MAADKKENEAEEDATSNGADTQDEYDRKFQEMQKYIPFLEMMIQRLERSGDKSREAQLQKMKSLRGILSNTKKKLKIETLKKCEDVLQKLHNKVEKVPTAQKKPMPQKQVTEKVSNNEPKGIQTSVAAEDKNDQQVVTSSTDKDTPVSCIMKTLKLAAARTNNKNVTSSTGTEEGRDEAHSTTSGMETPQRSRAQEVLEQSRERLKKLIGQQQLPSSSTDTPGGLSTWERDRLDPRNRDEDHWSSRDIATKERLLRPYKQDESYAGWNDFKPPARSVRPPEFSGERLGTVASGRPSVSPTSMNRVPLSLHSPTGGTSPTKKALPKIPSLYNVLKHPPAAGSKPLSDADIEELLEDTNRKDYGEPGKKDGPSHKSLRAKLEQEIQQMHRVGVSTGGALRTLMQKDDKLKSPVKSRLDLLKKDKSPTSGKVDSGVRGSEGDRRKQKDKDGNGDVENVKDRTLKLDSGDRKPTDPRRRATFSPRREEAFHNPPPPWEDIQSSPVGEKKDPRLRTGSNLDSRYEGSNSNNTDSSQEKSQLKKESSGILSSLSKEQLQKIVEANLRDLPSPPKDILETVNMIQSPLSSPNDFNQSLFTSPQSSTPHFAAQPDPSLGMGGSSQRGTVLFGSTFNGPRPEERRTLLPTPEVAADPRMLPRNVSHDPRCSRENQGPPHPIVQDPRLASSRHLHIESYRNGTVPHSPHDQYVRPAPNVYHQTSHPAAFHAGQTQLLQTPATRWAGTPCYGVLSHNSPRTPEDSFMHPSESFASHRFPAHSSQHEFSQFQGQAPRPLLDQFQSGHSSWQSPSSSFRTGVSGSYPMSGRPAHPVQHKGPVSDPRLSTSHFSSRLPLSTAAPQCTNPLRVATGARSVEGRSGNNLSDRDPRRRSVEESVKGDGTSQNRDSKDKRSSGSRGSSSSGQATIRRSSSERSERRRDSDSRKHESSRRRRSPDPSKSKEKEKELISPLDSLYGSAAVPKTGKGYGLQKFRIPKIKRPSPPPEKTKSPPPSSDLSDDAKEKDEPDTQAGNALNEEVSDQGMSAESAAVEKSDIDVENVGKNLDSKGEKASPESRTKEEFTQEWIEGLIRKSFESGEGKKFISEQAKLLEMLGESLRGKKLKRIRRILESDSDSDLDDSSKGNQEQKRLDKDEDKGKHLKDDESIGRGKKLKSRKIILSDDDHSTDSESLAVKLKRAESVTEDKSSKTLNKKDKKGKFEDNKTEEKEGENATADGSPKPVKKYAKRRSALELLQEDIREMFICEGVVTATGHRMCRLLKETTPGMAVDEVSKLPVKKTEDEISSTAEESDGSSVGKKRWKKSGKGKLAKRDKQKGKSRPKEIEDKPEKGLEDISNKGLEKSTNKIKNKGNDEMGDIPTSPTTKSRKRYEKSKWKGYVLESEDNSADETTGETKDMEDFNAEQLDFYYGRRTRPKLGLQEGVEENEAFFTERGRRTRVPRVILEKADISKLDVTSSKTLSNYFEDSSSDEEFLTGDRTSSPASSTKSRVKIAPKSRVKSKTAPRGKGRGSASRRGRKKCSKRDRNEEVSTDVESIVSDHSSVASSYVSQQTDWASAQVCAGFTFQRRGVRKGSKLLGKKIDDIINKLVMGVDKKEEQLPENNSVDISDSGNCVTDKEKKEKTSIGDVDEQNDHDSLVKSEENKVPVTKKKNARLMLSLVRRSGIQKKVKKKKTRWQLGIINQSKKKTNLKTKDVLSNVTYESKVGTEESEVVEPKKDVNIEVSVIEVEGKELSTNKEQEETSMNEEIVSETSKSKSNQEDGLSETSMTKIKGPDVQEGVDSSLKKLDDVTTCDTDSDRKAFEMEKWNMLHDKQYVLDGSGKYSCKLCPTQCKGIVSHYKNVHPDSEVLISRLTEEEAVKAIYDAEENKYAENVNEEREENVKSGKRMKKQAGEFICRMCNHIAIFPLNFYEHMSSHTGEYRFQCGKCPYKASVRHAVKGHFYNHHSEFRGIESVSIDILDPGPANNARFVLGYICSLCNYVQLKKENIVKHVSAVHTTDAKVICINLCRSAPNEEDAEVVKDEIITIEVKEDIGVQEISSEVTPCDVDSKSSEPKVMEMSLPQAPVVENSGDSLQKSPLEVKSKEESSTTTNTDLSVELSTGSVPHQPPTPVEDEKLEENKINSDKNSSLPTTAMPEISVTEDTSKEKSVAEDISKEKLVAEDMSKEKSVAEDTSKEKSVAEDSSKEKSVAEDTLKEKSVTEDTTKEESVAEDTSKEKCLKAFICLDDLEKENTVIQEERLKKMEEIAKDLKVARSKFLQSDRNSILDKLSDKLKTVKSNKSADTTVTDENSKLQTKESLGSEEENNVEKTSDTLIDEKRAIEAAQAVQNLMRAEGKTVDVSPNKLGKQNKLPGDIIERRITRSQSRNGDDEDDADDIADESSSDLSYEFEADDNDESEPHSPDVLLNETISVLKETPSAKSSSRMFNIIERLASKFVTKTELDKVNDADSGDASNVIEGARNNAGTSEGDVAMEVADNVESDETNKESPSETCEDTGVKEISTNIIGKPPPLISLGDKSLLRGVSSMEGEKSLSSVRVGPLEVRCFSDGLLYSCYVRGCIFASTNRTLFTAHVETHKVSRWDGTCKACDGSVITDAQHCKLVFALHHLVKHHLVTPPSAENSDVSEVELLDKAVTMEVAEKNLDGNLVAAEKNFDGNCVVPESEPKPTPEPVAPRNFIRLRRLSGDLLSVPKPPDEPAPKPAPAPTPTPTMIGGSDVQEPVAEAAPPASDTNAEDEGSADDSLPFLRIESVVSLNPDAMATDDVHEILKAVEEPQSTSNSSSPQKCDAALSTTVYTPTSAGAVPMLRTSSVGMLRGKGPVRMIPLTPLPKASTITILPSLQPVRLSNVQLSPVKLSGLTHTEITPKSGGGMSTNIPHSLVGLAQITRPTSSKMTVAKDRMLSGGGVWCNQVLPANMRPKGLPKGTFIRVEIKDNQVTSKMPIVIAPKKQAAGVVGAKNASSLALATENTPSSPSAEDVAPTDKPVSTSGVLSCRPASPKSSKLLSTVASKNKLPHKSAVAPSYAKASKVPLVYQEMIKPAKLRHLYKCMARFCSYTTDRVGSYTLHYSEHEAQLGHGAGAERKKRGRSAMLKMSDWQQCAYCCAMQTSLGGVLEHLQTEHGHCLYQCAYCFYRAVTKSYIVLHQNTSHTNEHVVVLMCKQLENLPPPVDLSKPRSSVIVPYICEQGSCGATFYITDNFLRHLEREHTQLAIYSCHICGSKSFKPDRLLAHYKLHSCCYYQCMYCLHGTDTKEEMHHHLCNCHSNQKARVIIRATDSAEISESASQDAEVVLNALNVLDLDEGLSDDSLLILPPPDREATPEDPSLSASVLEGSSLSSDVEASVEGTSEDVADADDALDSETGQSAEPSAKAADSSNEKSEDEIVVIDDEEESRSQGSKPPEPPQPSVVEASEEVNKASLNMSRDSDVLLLDESESGAGFEEPMVTVKHRNPIPIETAVDPLSMEPLQPEDSSQSEAAADEEDTGLTGATLYRCGYAACSFTAEDSSQLKDHLLVCDLARASACLACKHCNKQFKYASSLLEHLRTHGTRRFSCALCNFRAPVPQQVAKHLKQRHRISSTRVVPLNPLMSDPETAMFVVFPKDKGKGGRGGKGMCKDMQDARSKTVFLPEEVELLPRQAIYTRPVSCSTCLYATKVRSNMVRHLHLHTASVPPNNAPVNPVPCLQTNEMMFDKMANLAASSQMSVAAASAKSETPAGNVALTKELKLYMPKYVPEPERYVCGAVGCTYHSCDETMLRYHLRTLHFDETSYRCPHCPESLPPDHPSHVVPMDRMTSHLKMHDNRLYKCSYCIYHHFQRHYVERHLTDKHSEKRPFVHIVREPEMDGTATKPDVVPGAAAEAGVNMPWQCGLCSFQCTTRSEVLDHTWTVHGLKSQFKCGLCSYRSSSKLSFDSHFASKHPTVAGVEMVHVYRKVDVPQVPQSPVQDSGFDTTPLWRRDMQRVRHIRGILLEEEGDAPKPDIVHRTSIDVEEVEEAEGKFGSYGKPIGGNMYLCSLCNNYRTKFKADFRDHLYRELKYHKWVCTHCGLMSCNRSSLQKHSAKVHEKARKPEAIAPLTPNKEVEEWVEKVISTQLALMKTEQQAAASSSQVQPGPSGLLCTAGAGHIKVDSDDASVRDAGSDSENSRKLEEEDDGGSLYQKMKAAPGALKLLQFPCQHCSMKFSQVRSLKVHIRHSHLRMCIWTCGHCGYATISEEGVLDHSREEHPDTPVDCLPPSKGSIVKLDDKFWEREYGLGQGVEASSSSSSSSPTGSPTKKRLYPAEDKCLYCDYTCRSPSDLKYHMMRHWVQKPFKCGYCEFEGVREYEIKKHSAKVHPLKKLRVVEKPMPSQPEIRPLQRNKRLRPDVEEVKAAEKTESPPIEDTLPVPVDLPNTPNIFRCFYCPQRGTSVVSIHQHWQEKHKNKLLGPSGVLRHGLPFKYKEVNMKQFLKGQDGSAGRRPSFQCAYCKVRGTLALLEVHQKNDHPDKPFQVGQATFTRYECAVCHFAAFTVNTLRRHFDMEHAGQELRYLVRSAREELGSALPPPPSSAAPTPSPVPATSKYMCMWCEETCASEERVQVHHAMCHSHLPLRYSVERGAPSKREGDEDTCSAPKRPCVARKSTTLCPRLGRIHAVARKSTNPLPWQIIRRPPSPYNWGSASSSSRSESPAAMPEEFSFYGSRPAPVDKERITASVKLRNNLGVNMNMNLATMERFTNLYPVVKLKDLRHEKWGFL